MDKILVEIKQELGGLTKDTGLKTSDVRKISSKVFKKLENKSIDNVFLHCEELLNERSWAMGVIAYDWAYRVREQYNDKTYDVFYRWLLEYVRGWGDCDDFCTHAFGELIRQNKDLYQEVLKWTRCEKFWARRASAVVLIPSINHNDYEKIDPFQISNLLLKDENHLVLKGYGWMLKVFSQKEQDMVFHYLDKNRKIMPRIAFRYALEKIDTDKKAFLMK